MDTTATVLASTDGARAEAAAERVAPPVVWTIAGSDSGGGAGLQADLRAFAVFGVHGCSAVAALTAQNSVAVQRIDPVAPDQLDAQLAALAADLPPAAIKLGMPGSVENLRVALRWIERLRRERPLAVVVDPVLRSSTGARFADPALVAAYLDELLPRATLVTPNRVEAAALLGVDRIDGPGEVEDAARRLADRCGTAVVITGGDAGAQESIDYAFTPQARGWLSLPRIATRNDHGTGCTFASSAAAALALGYCRMDAIVLAKMATAQALRDSRPAGRGAGPVIPRAGFAEVIDNLPGLWTSPRPVSGFEPIQAHDLSLYAVVDSADWVERVLAAGVRTVQLRIKDRGAPGLAAQVARSVAAARAHDAQFYLNDHWRLAIEHRAWGVHLGQEDLETADLAAIRDAGLRLGVSTHSYWEVCRAWALKPSYIACGPIHPTASKAMPWIPQGEGNLAYWSQLLPVPVVGIAGIDAPRARRALRCGAAGAVVMSGITAAPDPEAAIATLREAVTEGGWGPRIPAPPLARPTFGEAA